MPDNPIAQLILEELGEPLFSSTLILPDSEYSMSDPYEIRGVIEHEVDLIIDAGIVNFAPTTVIDLTDKVPEVIRQGEGFVPVLGA